MLFNTEIDICSKIVRSRTFCKINNVKNKKKHTTKSELLGNYSNEYAYSLIMTCDITTLSQTCFNV